MNKLLPGCKSSGRKVAHVFVLLFNLRSAVSNTKKITLYIPQQLPGFSQLSPPAHNEGTSNVQRELSGNLSCASQETKHASSKWSMRCGQTLLTECCTRCFWASNHYTTLCLWCFQLPLESSVLCRCLQTRWIFIEVQDCNVCPVYSRKYICYTFGIMSCRVTITVLACQNMRMPQTLAQNALSQSERTPVQRSGHVATTAWCPVAREELWRLLQAFCVLEILQSIAITSYDLLEGYT